MLIIAGLIAAVTAATTATTVVSVSAGIGITAAIAKKVADNIEEENYASIQRAKESANHKIKSMVHENLQKKDDVKSAVLSNLKSDISASSLSEISKLNLINKLNLPKNTNYTGEICPKHFVY